MKGATLDCRPGICRSRDVTRSDDKGRDARVSRWIWIERVRDGRLCIRFEPSCRWIKQIEFWKHISILCITDISGRRGQRWHVAVIGSLETLRSFDIHCEPALHHGHECGNLQV